MWLLYLPAELVYHDEVEGPHYRMQSGKGIVYDPPEGEREWMARFLITPGAIGYLESARFSPRSASTIANGGETP